MMRVKAVTMTKIDGAMLRIVSRAMIWTIRPVAERLAAAEIKRQGLRERRRCRHNR